MTPRMFAFGAVVVLSLSSCAGTGARFAVVEGNILFGRGAFQEAIASYSRATADADLSPWASFGVGTVYLAIGELESALGRFSAAAEAEGDGREERELRYRARYNAGVARFRAADFAGAAAEFRAALEIDGTRAGAKRNLEIGLRMLSRKTSPAASSAQLGLRQENDEPKTLFEYIREKESDRWKSREWRGQSTEAPDY